MVIVRHDWWNDTVYWACEHRKYVAMCMKTVGIHPDIRLGGPSPYKPAGSVRSKGKKDYSVLANHILHKAKINLASE